MQPDPTYYRRRFVDEMLAAQRSACSEAEACHLQLAHLYLRRSHDPRALGERSA